MMDNKVMRKRQLVGAVVRRSGPWGLTRREVRDALHGILDVSTGVPAQSMLPALFKRQGVDLA